MAAQDNQPGDQDTETQEHDESHDQENDQSADQDQDGKGKDENQGDKKDGDKDDKKPRSKKPLIILGIVILVMLIAGLIYWLATRNLESTDDAYTEGNTVTMAPKVSGLHHRALCR